MYSRVLQTYFIRRDSLKTVSFCIEHSNIDLNPTKHVKIYLNISRDVNVRIQVVRKVSYFITEFYEYNDCITELEILLDRGILKIVC